MRLCSGKLDSQELEHLIIYNTTSQSLDLLSSILSCNCRNFLELYIPQRSAAIQKQNYPCLGCAELPGICTIPKLQQDSETSYFTYWVLSNPHLICLTPVLFIYLIWTTEGNSFNQWDQRFCKMTNLHAKLCCVSGRGRT